jgi:tetratricopeptide (TPR) repeat protein
LSKRRRAALHESFADALERWAGSAVSAYEEIEGYHLEQAYRCRVELRPAGDEEVALAIRAGIILASAGRRALSARGDVRAAVGLLDRSSELLPPEHPERHRVLTVLGAALREHGNYERAARCLDEAVARAHSTGDVSMEWRAIVERLEVQRIVEGGSFEGEAREQLARWIPVLERAEDHAGLAKAWRMRTWLDWDQGSYDDSGRAGEQGVREARLAGEDGEAAEIAAGLALGWFFGPMPSSQGIDRCAALREELRGHLRSEAFVSIYLGGLYALQGRAIEAGREIDEGERIVSETSIRRWSSFGAEMRLFSSVVLGGSVRQEDLRAGDGDEDDLWSLALRCRATSAAGRFDEALATLETIASEGDFQFRANAFIARSEALLGLGRVAEAKETAEKAETLLTSTDALLDKGEAKLALARALREMGSRTDSRAKTAEAIELFDAKEALPLARRARALYESLR